MHPVWASILSWLFVAGGIIAALGFLATVVSLVSVRSLEQRAKPRYLDAPRDPGAARAESRVKGFMVAALVSALTLGAGLFIALVVFIIRLFVRFA